MSTAPEQVVITDVLLRDGLQNESTVLPLVDKLRLAYGLLEAGLTSLEVGSFVSPRKVPQLADTDRLVARLRPGESVLLHTLVFNERGASRAIGARARDVRLTVSASDGHSLANAGVPRDEALERLRPAVDVLRAHRVRLEATIATAFVCPFDGETDPRTVVELARRLAGSGIRVLHLADTIGAASPWHIRRTVTAVRDALPELPLGLHLHNTYGMASANVWEALRLGVRRFDAALGGIGGCPFAPGAAGNLGTDDLVNLSDHRTAGEHLPASGATCCARASSTVTGTSTASACTSCSGRRPAPSAWTWSGSPGRRCSGCGTGPGRPPACTCATAPTARWCRWRRPTMW
ncbi:hydroxymethylglutaryl-CoA lyase [Actinacidiphila glaucinigra]|uniref:hydroxymethylglutaryl-CoA lyase n=1 Tax=Actinacidiphila glaucinigra TaxID=235986 RepID=UPI002DD80241|nr:hydroxymethylglutaryl-CoA lyase [Actinacidiphila glaucinigra]WSD58056.1 hydroxymethylglutaryl-CoA lyase [Actinacidiphila glaucinigra]